jgi:menaquinone-specific isochorismate synthase
VLSDDLGNGLIAETRALPEVPDLTELLSIPTAGGFVTADGGVVGLEPVRRLVVSGAGRFSVADRWWRRLASRIEQVPSADGAPEGPVALGSFAFSDSEAASILTVPRRTIRVANDRAWVTLLRSRGEEPPTLPPLRPRDNVDLGSDATHLWTERVAEAIAAIRTQALDKVVLARRVSATVRSPIDVGGLVRNLREEYPDATAFAHEGLVGASPELLVRLRDGVAEAAALAGTRVVPAGESAADAARELLMSGKRLAEFAHVEDWVREKLAGVCESMATTARSVRRFGRLMHIESMTSGPLGDTDLSSLDLVTALHPTPAVCGFPAAAARSLIGQMEPVDRGRYAGPVGWIDSSGNGEWLVALRCCELRDQRVEAFAGCGIVAGSTPEVELAESSAKLESVLRFLPLAERVDSPQG